MRRFIKKALEIFQKLDKKQVYSLLVDMATENERLEMAIESMPDGIMVSDKEHRLVLVNKTAERLLHITMRDLNERLVWEIVNDQEVSDFIRQTLTNQEKIPEKEFTMNEGNGNMFILSFIITPYVKEGTVEGNLIHISDITERKKREARLRRAESLASLTTLAAGVAHEIKNPLGSISIHIQLIKKSIQKKKKIEQAAMEDHLKIIDEEINRLNGIIVDFLFAVRPMNTNLEKESINDIIEDLMEFIRPELESAKITVELGLEKDLPYLPLDVKYIKQALLNIIKNAEAAMPEGGYLRVTTRQEEGFITVKIADSGAGIPDHLMDKIFEPYFTTKEFGSGLGLTLVYKIIKEHDGEISVESREGKGTTFSLNFPIPQKEQRLIDFKGADNEV
ncbi:MAG: PAS domain S-box protein [Spirochaetales bacterium]|nr:MAG: PAS domain S-box protein [Spirochaetales bacterium]